MAAVGGHRTPCRLYSKRTPNSFFGARSRRKLTIQQPPSGVSATSVANETVTKTAQVSGAADQSAAIAPRGVSVDLWRRCRGKGARAVAAAELSDRLARVSPFVFDELRDRLPP